MGSMRLSIEGIEKFKHALDIEQLLVARVRRQMAKDILKAPKG